VCGCEFWLFCILRVCNCGWQNTEVPKCAVGRVGNDGLYLLETLILARLRVSANDLLIGDGRDTKALNCKPTTNL